jgi:gliding motility-associated-like protein
MYRSSMYRSCFAAVLLLLQSAVSWCQNLVPNYSFETYSSCPAAYGVPGPTVTVAPPWVVPTVGSADIFNVCCNTPNLVDIPSNFFGNQDPVTGQGYAGFYAKLASNEYREYLQAPLLEPLVAGEWYAVSFFVSNSELGCGVERLGAYFSTDAFTVSNALTLNFVPQVESYGGYLSDEVNWMLIEGCFQAVGGEAHITIGCFHNDGNNPTDPACGGQTSYYYVDDITVMLGNEPNEVFFDLGGPEEACLEYEIDPDVSGDYNYVWETGSHQPTLVVTESGTYSLTVTDGCNFGVDSIEVIVLGNQPPVDIPETFVELCAGETFTVDLDPDLYNYTWQDGSNDASYDIAESGTYSVTLDDGCVASEDEVEVIFYDPIEPIDLGEDQDLCFEATITWSFDPSLGDYIWQDGSTSSEYTIIEAGTYSLTITNVCGDETDEIIISPLDIPEIDLGPDELLLCGDDIYDIEFDPDLGEFVWQDGTTFNYYTIDAPGTYTVFVTNQCGTGSDQMVVTEADSPVFDFGPDISDCNGQTIILEAGDVEGTYTWQDGSHGAIFNVTSSGVYALTISNVCGTFSDMINVNFGQGVAQPDLGPDVNLCPGEELILSINDPGASFLWQDGSTNNSLLVTAPGTYFVTAQNACSALSDTIVVTLNAQPPTLNLPDNITLCQGQSVTVESGISGVTYLWSDASTDPSLIVNSAGVYALTVTNSCGTSVDQVNVIDGGPAPMVDLGSDLALCPGESQLITPVFADVGSWLWSDGSTDTSIEIDAAGITSVIVTNSCGTSYDTLHTILLPATPAFDLGNDTVVCAGEIINLSIPLPDVSIEWSDGSTDPDFITNTAGQYFATISNACGEFADTILISNLPAIPALDLGADQSLCPGELIVIDPGILNVDYLWQDGSTGTSFSTTQAASISLTISNACGASTDNVEVIESTQGPNVDLGADITGCVNESVTIQSGISGVDYLWQDGSTLPSFTTSASGEYILTVTNNCGTDIDTILVDLSGTPPVVNLGVDVSLCEGETIILSANAPAGTSILWQDGSTGQTFEVTDQGTYTLQLTNSCGDVSDAVDVSYTAPPAAFSLGVDTLICEGTSIIVSVNIPTGAQLNWSDGSSLPLLNIQAAGNYSATLTNACGNVSDDIAVAVLQAPAAFNLGSDVILCPGESITLTAPLTSGQLLWQDGSIEPTIIANTAQTYSLQISNACGTTSDAVDLAFDNLMPVIPFDPVLKLCPPESITLDALQPFAATYQWSTGDTGASIDVNLPGTYSVTVSSDCSTDQADVDIEIDQACIPKTNFYLPNVFSPNGDGINDVFTVAVSQDASIVGMEGTIYDRWGSVVFSSTDNPFTWNGARGSESLNPGVYVYLVKVAHLSQGAHREEVLTGDVTLLR